MIPAGWRQEGHMAIKTLLQFLYSTWMTTKMGQIYPVVPRVQPHLPMRNSLTMGNLAKLQDGVPVIMKVIDLMPCREASGGGG